MTSVKEIRSVRNACVLLAAIARHQPVGVSHLARLTGIDKSAAHRVAVTLKSAGWLDKTPDGQWRFSAGLGPMLRSAATDTLTASLRTQLESLRDQTGETVMLVTIEGDCLLVREVAESHHNLRITAPVGAELPLLHSSAARAIAAHLPPDELQALRQILPGLDDDRALSVVRRRGWALNDREIVDDARVVGAPVLSEQGYPLAAIIVCAPTSRVSRDRMLQIGAQVAETATGAAVG